MSNDAKRKWDDRYRKHPSVTPAPTQVLSENLHLLPKNGDALDLASGLGGNALLLAKTGLKTSAWDISSVALQQLKASSDEAGYSIETKACDVVEFPPEPNSFDVIVVSRFLERSLFPGLTCALRPGGILFYQTFTLENIGKSGPANPSFLLKTNELLVLLPHMMVLSFRDEGRQGDTSQGLRNESWIVVKKVEVEP